MISARHHGCTNASGPMRDVNATDDRRMRCRQFDPPCVGDHSWGTTPGSDDPTEAMGRCSGNWIAGTIVDEIIVPTSLSPGAYVLGFRWDGEQTSQVWSSCADIQVVA